jgi:indolepyruvate ferredoxin oxidoreductase
MREMLAPGSDLAPAIGAFRLEDRYAMASGRAHTTGLGALVRGVVDALRDDRAAGRRSAGFVSGYQGSPLGAVDQEVRRAAGLAQDVELRFRAGVNEELGATAVWGTQLLAGRPGARVDGVLGVWFGKAPGLDRAADAIRHGNLIGTDPAGGVVALVGDDPAAKSSTLPSASEPTLAALQVPVLYPGDVQEAVDLVRHAAALSRLCGLWAAVKVVTAVADAHGTVRLAPERVRPVRPERAWPADAPYRHRPSARILPPTNLELERSLVEVRLPLAVDYLRANGLNVVHGCADERAEIGIVAAGRTWHELVQALHDVGLDEHRLAAAGVRLLQVRAPWPADVEGLRAFAGGLDEVLVVEEKSPFLEPQLRDALYGRPGAPRRIVGARDHDGTPLVPASGELDADAILRVVGPRLRPLLAEDERRRLDARLDRLAPAAPRTRPVTLPLAPPGEAPARTPFFCSGCPHNTSLRTPDGVVVGAGIGCHTMALLDQTGKGEVLGATQMGGEGAQFVGLDPFVEHEGAWVQNLGDGTFAHSGSLAVRFAVASGVRTTFRLLHNGAVAMTGGQRVEGGIGVPELTRLLEAEGVVRTIITSERPEAYRGAALAANAEVRDRDAVGEALAELRAIDGVTVLLHDQGCAAEKRRARRRGTLPTPAARVTINERVCEGCGDCGAKSGCLSVEPVETELGRKTRIHQSSCNVDGSCLAGECPSFLTVVPAERRRGLAGRRARRRAAAAADAPPPGAPVRPEPPDDLPAPPWRGGTDGREVTVRLCGVGGTGVVTVSHLLGVAALLEGREARGLDQTGLSQKGGNVISDVRIGDASISGGARASRGTLDALLALDLLSATVPAQLAGADAERTRAVVSTSRTPTGRQVIDAGAAVHHSGPLLVRVLGRTRAADAVALDAVRIAEALVGDHLAANVVVLGAAVQSGAVPLRPASLERAIELGGVAVAANVAALRWGRAAVAAPERLAAALASVERRERGMDLAEPAAPLALTRVVPAGTAGDRDRDAERLAALAPALRAAVDAVAPADEPAAATLRHVLAVRVGELVAYQDRRLARRYLDEVAAVAAREEDRVPGSRVATTALARGLFHLLAAKDEYEIARLHLDPAERERVRRTFGPGAQVRIQLDPPQLRRWRRGRGKLGVGGWATPGLHALRAGRRLRGTPLDPFGRSPVRRTDRALPAEYLALAGRALDRLRPETVHEVTALLALAETVRGYEQVRLDAVARFRAAAAAALERLERPGAASDARGENVPIS